MSATATPTEVQPKDLQTGQPVSLNGGEIRGVVEKVDKKGGRLKVATEDGTCNIRFRDILGVEVLSGPEGEAEEKAAEPARFPTSKELQDEADAARAAAAERKRAGKAKAGTSRRYPEEISDAVRLAKAARGTTNGAPGAKQHVHAREVLVKEYLVRDGKQATPDSVLEAAFGGGGVKSKTLKKLREIADGTAPKSDLQALRPLAGKMEDPFCKGRNLASILVAWVEQLQAEAKS